MNIKNVKGLLEALNGDVEVLNSRWAANSVDDVRDNFFVVPLHADDMRTKMGDKRIRARLERDIMAIEQADLSEVLVNSSEVLDNLSTVLTNSKDVLIKLGDVLIKLKMGEINPSEIPVHGSNVRNRLRDMLVFP